MINVAKLLKDAPKGMKLYSPLFGEVKFLAVDSADLTIVVETERETYEWFSAYGKYKVMKSHLLYSGAECLLFPSKEVRTWEGWKAPVEPNFKVGDWVVGKNGEPFPSGNYAEQITIIEDNEKGKRIWLSSTLWVENDYIRLWTIEDANPGDILIDGTTNTIGIFKEINKTHWYSKIYCGNATWGSVFRNGGLHKIEATKPAIKEQRDLLFAKMQEAGYKWDAEKKEWKEPKPHYGISNFKPFDKVLCRGHNRQAWRPSLYGFYDTAGKYPMFACATASYLQCIPFEENKHLLGTTDMPDECYINW